MSTVSSTTSLLTASTTSTATTTSGTSSSSSTSSGSDIDWSGLIEEAVNAKLAKANSIDVKVSNNELKIAAYNSVSSLLTTLQTAAQSLRSPSGSTYSSVDAFLARSAYLTANGSVDASSSLSATVEAGADTGSYKLEILQLAQSHKVASATSSSNTTDLGYSGVVSLGIEGGTAVEIEVDENMSLIEIAEAINLAKGTSGVQASVVKVTASDYRLVLSGVDTGATITASAVSGDDVFGELGILASDGTFANQLQEAKQAIIEIDDIQITRSSNQIDDVLDGTTIYLYQTTPADTSITLEVGADVSSVKSGVVALVDAYNAYREFAISQQTLPSSSSESVLFGDGTLRSINLAVGTALTSVIDSQSLALLGLTFDENNYLELDEDVLDNMLLTDLDAVRSLLAFQMTASNKNLQLLARGSSVPPDFTLDITVDSSGSISDVSVGGQSGLFTISGTRIIGATGSAYEGFTFVYSSSNSASVSVSLGTGIAEQLYNIANGATNSSTGTLTALTSDLKTYNDDLTARSETIRERAETYRTNLTSRYAQYQAAIATAEAMQDYLTSLLDTWNASS